MVSSDVIARLMSIKQLKFLYIEPERNFSAEKFPEHGNLSECHLCFDEANEPTIKTGRAIIDMLKQMPNLRTFKFERYLPDTHPCHLVSQRCDILFHFIKFAASIYREIEITSYRSEYGKLIHYKLKIEQKSVKLSSKQRETLDLSFVIYYPTTVTFLERLKDHFKENLKDLQIFCT